MSNDDENRVSFINVEENGYDLQVRQFFLEVFPILQQGNQLFDVRDQMRDFYLNNCNI